MEIIENLSVPLSNDDFEKYCDLAEVIRESKDCGWKKCKMCKESHGVDTTSLNIDDISIERLPGSVITADIFWFEIRCNSCKEAYRSNFYTIDTCVFN